MNSDPDTFQVVLRARNCVTCWFSRAGSAKVEKLEWKGSRGTLDLLYSMLFRYRFSFFFSLFTISSLYFNSYMYFACSPRIWSFVKSILKLEFLIWNSSEGLAKFVMLQRLWRGCRHSKNPEKVFIIAKRKYGV